MIKILRCQRPDARWLKPRYYHSLDNIQIAVLVFLNHLHIFSPLGFCISHKYRIKKEIKEETAKRREIMHFHIFSKYNPPQTRMCVDIEICDVQGTQLLWIIYK